MDSNELELNDWVYEVYEHDSSYGTSQVIREPSRVVGLGLDDIRLSNDTIDTDGELEKYRVEPIPLTEEILLANGFTEKEVEDYSCFGFGSLYSYETEGREVAVFWQDSCNAMTAAGTEYTTDLVWNVTMFGGGGEFDKTYRNRYIDVHEFQHALRLCGFDELANNLKIK